MMTFGMPRTTVAPPRSQRDEQAAATREIRAQQYHATSNTGTTRERRRRLAATSSPSTPPPSPMRRASLQVVDAPMLPTKFLCLKHLIVRLSLGTTITQAFDYFSLVSFLDASPSLETFILNVSEKGMIHESISAHPQLRHTPEHHHGHLRSVKICGFSSEKSLFELTRYILENAVSLKFLTLDTFYGDRCGQGKCTSCLPTPDVFMDVSKAISGIKTYIENKVPSTVKLTVLEPCSRCHVRRVI
ncbi:uncharacterized protein [Zea mays]|uniref:uncharacterized protein isoform X1 n=1 Tax=Zea mays TaxID=4577 RepID=UPI0009A9C7CE|nr:uncharacterized protein LOC103650862 isoform X1 [Zea mays]|eukprot:XP_020405975.1 uncharacterized protein LOC103650862 isoform X1 [Zea mays]